MDPMGNEAKKKPACKPSTISIDFHLEVGHLHFANRVMKNKQGSLAKSMKYWLFNRGPYFIAYYNPDITG